MVARVRSRLLVRGVAAVLVLVFALVACGSGSSTDGDVASSDRVAELVDQLAAAGIAVFEEPDDDTPVAPPAEPTSPVTLLRWQVHALAAELASRGGVTATELDAMADGETVGDLSVKASAVVDGWAAEAGTPAAAMARELLAGDPDWPDIMTADERPVYSSLVLLLFVADLAAAGASLDEETATPTRHAPPRPGAVILAGSADAIPLAAEDVASGPCSAGLAYLNGAVAATFDALRRLATPPPVATGFGLFDAIANAVIGGVAGAANLVIDGAEIVIDGVIRATVGEVMAVVARVAGVLGTLAQIKSYVQPWELEFAADPEGTATVLAPAAEGKAGTVAVAVKVPFGTWPGWMVDCAAAAGKPLPNLAPSGQSVTWDLYTAEPRALARIEDSDRMLGSDATARLTYRTAVQEVEPDPRETGGYLYVVSTITRDDVWQLTLMLNGILNQGIASLLPGITVVPGVAAFVQQQTQALTRQVLGEVLAKLATIRDRRSHVVVPLTHYLPGEDDPQPGTPTEPPTAPAVAPEDRTCPFVSDAEASEATGVGGLASALVLFPGELDTVNDVVVPWTYCAWRADPYTAWVTVVRPPHFDGYADSFADLRAEYADRADGSPSLYRFEIIPGPWSEAFRLRTVGYGSEQWPKTEVFALGPDIGLEAHIVGPPGTQAAHSAVPLAELVYRRVAGG
jgi:hypothetical protein